MENEQPFFVGLWISNEIVDRLRYNANSFLRKGRLLLQNNNTWPQYCWNNFTGLHKHQLYFLSWLKAVTFSSLWTLSLQRNKWTGYFLQLLVIEWIWTRCFIKVVIYTVFFYKDMSPESLIFAILLSATIGSLNLPWKTKGFGQLFFFFSLWNVQFSTKPHADWIYGWLEKWCAISSLEYRAIQRVYCSNIRDKSISLL